METKNQAQQVTQTNEPRDRGLTLHVKAKELYAKYPASKADVDEFTALVDDEGFGNEYGEPNKDFETIVYMNHNMVWNSTSRDPDGRDSEYRVTLDTVKHMPTAGNPNFFDKETLIADWEPGPNYGKVIGTISKNPNLENKDDSYTIQFIITGPKMSREFVLDPKLRIKPSN